MLKIIILLKRWHNDNIVIKRWSRTSLVSKTYILSVSIIFFLNEYCWLFVYFISFLVYVSNRTMIWHFLMMWKLRFKKNLVQYASQTCIRLVLSRNLNSYPSLIGIEKSKCLLLTNWSVIDLNFFFLKLLFIMWWSDTNYNYPLSQIVVLVFHFGISPIFKQ